MQNDFGLKKKKDLLLTSVFLQTHKSNVDLLDPIVKLHKMNMDNIVHHSQITHTDIQKTKKQKQEGSLT